MEYREVNGQHLIPIGAYRLGDDYLLTKSPGYRWHASRVIANDGTLVLELVGTWFELPDAVQGALHDRQQRPSSNNIVDGSALTECSHEWVAGMMIVHPEDLDQVARERSRMRGCSPVTCSKCDEEYLP